MGNRPLSILSKGLATKLHDFRLRNAVLAAGYDDLESWHGPLPKDFGLLPQARFERGTVYTATPETYGYSHHAQICKFAGRYVLAWSNGLRHEDRPGQQVHYSTSVDGLNWEPRKFFEATDPNSPVVRTASGLLAWGDRLVAYCMTEVKKEDTEGEFPWSQGRLDAFVTSDLREWEEHQGLLGEIVVLEGPRPTSSGSLLCPAVSADRTPVALLWDGREPWSSPEVIGIPNPEDGAWLTEGSWYETDDGRLFVFWRDDGGSLSLHLTCSEDGGRNWSVPVRTDFPDSTARMSAGRLSDGRYYIVGNSVPELLNRKYLMLSLSSDGAVFDKMYILASGPTHRRIEGRHKEDGYQYPHTLVDGDRLLVAFSVNKEDVECGVVDTSGL